MSLKRIEDLFITLKNNGEKALIPFITAGYPDNQTCTKILCALPDCGADMIELGLPFSDPMADGPTIQESSFKALEKGFRTDDFFKIVQEFRTRNSQTPLIMMGYYNSIYAYGAAKFIENAATSGIDGFIIVDLPPEEEGELLPLLESHDLALIRLVAPTSTGERLDKITEHASGFLYYIAIKGVTGTASSDVDSVIQAVTSIRKKSNLPIVTGFGIKTPDQAAQMAQSTDGVVVGSAVVEIVAKSLEEERDPVQSVQDFVKTMAQAVKKQDKAVIKVAKG